MKAPLCTSPAITVVPIVTLTMNAQRQNHEIESGSVTSANVSTISPGIPMPWKALLLAMYMTAPAMNTVNTFEKPDAVKPARFAGIQVQGDQISLSLPSKSVVVLEIQ